MELHKELYVKEGCTEGWLRHMGFAVNQKENEILFCWQEMLLNKLAEGRDPGEAIKALRNLNVGVTGYFLTNFAEKRSWKNLVAVYERTRTVRQCNIHEEDAEKEWKRRKREWEKTMREISTISIEL